LCPKVNRFLDRVYHPDRLLTPLRRTGPKGSGEFEPVSWDEAIAEIAARLGALVDASKAESILQFSFDGTQGPIQNGVMAHRFFDAIGASDIGRDLCGVTAKQAMSDVYGIPFGFDPESLSESRTIILWGTNTLLTNRHLWPVIQSAQSKGAVVIVIDPIRTQTANEADEFFQVKPGTDAALVLGMVHIWVRDQSLDQQWLDEHTSGWDELRVSALEWNPQQVSDVTGISVDRIEWLADRYLTGTPSAIRILVGPEHREHGRDLMRSICMLPAVTGAWRQRGGGIARSTSTWLKYALNTPEGRPRRRQFNMARLGEILNDPSFAIDAIVVHNSNPAVVVPDQNRIIAGLERDDLFTVVIEQFMTDTAQYADFVLPATTQIEHLDLGVSWGHFYLSLNQPAIEPCGESLPNSEIFRRLAAAMGLHDAQFGDTDEELIRQLLDSDHPWMNGISYERLAAEGWARIDVAEDFLPYIDSQPTTANRRMNLDALEFRHGSETVQGNPELAARFPLTLISRKQHQKFLNANYGGFDAHLPSAGEPLLQIDEVDAQSRGISTGDLVRVFNDRGSLTLRAQVSSEVQLGVVAMPFGWWNRSTPEGRAVNALTNPTVGSDDAGSAYFHENLVEVERVDS